MTFHPGDSSTWPAMLTVVHVAAIFGGRSVLGLRKQCQRGTFTPLPAQVRPYLWRKVDVVRHVEGQRGGSLRRVS
jgi:hypothetical protein